MINKEALVEIKISTSFDDRPFLIKNFTSFADQFLNHMYFYECFGECNYFDCHVLPIMEWGDTASSMKISFNDQAYLNKKKAIENDEYENYLAPQRTESMGKKRPIDYLNDKNTLIIYNYEKYNNLSRDMSNALLDVFTLDVDCFGVWPAFVTPEKGAVHATYVKNNQMSGHPRGESYNSFYLQTTGTSEFVVYKNRTSGLVDKNLPFDWTKEKRIQFFNSLDEAKIFELEPGDLLYIPERLMHYERGEGERMYLNFPLITKGPHSSYNPII